MKSKLGIAFAILVSAMIAGAGGGQCVEAGNQWLLACPVDSATAVRFFYNPPAGAYFHFPLVLCTVTAGDARLSASRMQPEGRVSYVTQADMARLLRGLAAAGLSWRVSIAVQPLGSFKKLGTLPPEMQILVVSSKGTAWAFVDPKQICTTLAPLDSAIKTPRALWQFQRLRVDDRCAVQGFNWDAYPEYP